MKCYVQYLCEAVVLCLILAPGFNTSEVPLEDDLTVLIDYVKYQELTHSHRTQRQLYPFARQFDPLKIFRLPSIFPTPPPPTQHPRDHQNNCEDKDCGRIICDDPENEVYQSCGSKCVLGCRYAATTSTSGAISKYECEKNDCVEGCFCKTGLVRHQTKCIPAAECPVRKCNNRNEVYMCGAAAPITCDNALRANEILELTRHVRCVWGCYCAQGYLRNNYNGKCVSENECRNTKFIEISPQIPGLFKHIQSPIPESGCDSNGCIYIDQSGDGCGQYGCASTEEDQEGNGENNGWPISGGSLPGGFLPGIPLLNWSGKVTHFHHWNDTAGPNAVENSPDGCAGKYGCNGELPTTSISLENGTTITIPILPGTQIDVATGTINTSPAEKDVENAQNDAEILDDVEDDSNESEMQNDNKKPSHVSATSATQASSKPDGAPNHNNLNPFANQYLQYPHFAFNPNAPQFPQASQFSSQQYPFSSQFSQSSQHPHGFGGPSSSGPSSFSPQHFYNQPFVNVPPHTLVVKSPHSSKGTAASVSNQDKNSKEKDEPRKDDSDDGNQSDDTQSVMSVSNTAQKNPPAYQNPYYNYFNTFNPNQYYQSNYNGVKNPNSQSQFFAPNPQFNQFSAQYNPYNFQQSPNHYNNPQFSSNQGVMNANSKKQKHKYRPNESENPSTTAPDTFKHAYNRRTRPNTHKKAKPTHNKNSHTADEIEIIDADKDFDTVE